MNEAMETPSQPPAPFKEVRLNGGGLEPIYDGYSRPESIAADTAKNFEGLPGQMPAPIDDVSETQQKRL